MDSHVDEMVMKPTQHFRSPADVLTHPGLSHNDRLRILESWKLDAQRLTESTAENMTGGEEADLREVSKALVHLKNRERSPRRNPSEARPVMAGMVIGGLLGAAAGLVAAAAAATASITLIAQTSVAGLLIGGVAGALRGPQPGKERA